VPSVTSIENEVDLNENTCNGRVQILQETGLFPYLVHYYMGRGEA
jgi:hypothetical protein